MWLQLDAKDPWAAHSDVYIQIFYYVKLGIRQGGRVACRGEADPVGSVVFYPDP